MVNTFFFLFHFDILNNRRITTSHTNSKGWIKLKSPVSEMNCKCYNIVCTLIYFKAEGWLSEFNKCVSKGLKWVLHCKNNFDINSNYLSL